MGLYVYVITVTASSSVYDNTQLLDAVRYLNYTLFELYDNSTWLLLDLVITSGRCVTQQQLAATGFSHHIWQVRHAIARGCYWI